MCTYISTLSIPECAMVVNKSIFKSPKHVRHLVNFARMNESKSKKKTVNMHSRKKKKTCIQDLFQITKAHIDFSELLVALVL